MPRQPTISYNTGLGADGKPKAITADYYLATTQDVMQFYCFDEPAEQGSEGKWELIFSTSITTNAWTWEINHFA